jgi:hypothetical protein
MEGEWNMKKREGYLKLREEVNLGQRGLELWVYGKKGQYVGRLEISHAGLAAFAGNKGKKRLVNLSWEKLFERFAPGKPKEE